MISKNTWKRKFINNSQENRDKTLINLAKASNKMRKIHNKIITIINNRAKIILYFKITTIILNIIIIIKILPKFHFLTTKILNK